MIHRALRVASLPILLLWLREKREREREVRDGTRKQEARRATLKD